MTNRKPISGHPVGDWDITNRKPISGHPVGDWDILIESLYLGTLWETGI